MGNVKWTLDAYVFQKEIERIYNEHYSNANDQSIHDFYNAVIRRIIRYANFRSAEVVRCKDCKHWSIETGWCEAHSHFFNDGMCWDIFCENDFCSYGERKDNEGNP